MKKREMDEYVRRAVNKNLPEKLIIQKMVKEGFSERDVHQAIKKAEYKYKSKKNKKVPKILYIIPILIPLIIICYVVYMNWLPFGFEKVYYLDIGGKEDTKPNDVLYLRDLTTLGRISETKVSGNETCREIYDTPVYIHFKPPIRINNNTIVETFVVVHTNKSLDYGITDYETYYWVNKIEPNPNKYWTVVAHNFTKDEIVYNDNGEIIFSLHSIDSNLNDIQLDKFYIRIKNEK